LLSGASEQISLSPVQSIANDDEKGEILTTPPKNEWMLAESVTQDPPN
jgi:hypothetical protein